MEAQDFVPSNQINNPIELFLFLNKGVVCRPYIKIGANHQPLQEVQSNTHHPLRGNQRPNMDHTNEVMAPHKPPKSGSPKALDRSHMVTSPNQIPIVVSILSSTLVSPHLIASSTTRLRSSAVIGPLNTRFLPFGVFRCCPIHC